MPGFFAGDASRQPGLPSKQPTLGRGSREWAVGGGQQVRRQLTIHNSLFTIQHSSSTTPLTNLAYFVSLVKRHNVRHLPRRKRLGPCLCCISPTPKRGKSRRGAYAGSGSVCNSFRFLVLALWSGYNITKFISMKNSYGGSQDFTEISSCNPEEA